MKRLTAVQTISPKKTIPTTVLINEFKSILVHPPLEPSPVALEAISILKRPIVLKIDADETNMMIGHIAILFKTAAVMAGVRAPKTVLVWESEDKPPTVRIYCLPDDTPGKPIFDAAFRYWNSQTRVIKNGATIDAVMIPKPDEIGSARFKFNGVEIEFVAHSATPAHGRQWDISDMNFKVENPYATRTEKDVMDAILGIQRNTPLQIEEYYKAVAAQIVVHATNWLSSPQTHSLTSDEWAEIFQIVQSEPAISTPATLKSIEKRIAAAKKFETVCHAFVSSPDNINAAKALAKELGYKMLPTFDALVENLSSRIQTAIDLPMTMTCLLKWEKQDAMAVNESDRATLRTFHQNNQTRLAITRFMERPTHAAHALAVAQTISTEKKPLTQLPPISELVKQVGTVHPGFTVSELDRLKWIDSLSREAPELINEVDRQYIHSRVTTELTKILSKPSRPTSNLAMAAQLHGATVALFPKSGATPPVIWEHAALLHAIALIGVPDKSICTELKTALNAHKPKTALKGLVTPVNRWLESPQVTAKISSGVIAQLTVHCSGGQVIDCVRLTQDRMGNIESAYQAMVDSNWGTTETVNWIRQLNELATTDDFGLPITFLSVLETRAPEMDRKTRIRWLNKLHSHKDVLESTVHWDAIRNQLGTDIKSITAEICTRPPHHYPDNFKGIDIQEIQSAVCGLSLYYANKPPIALACQVKLLSTLDNLNVREAVKNDPVAYETVTESIRDTPGTILNMARGVSDSNALMAVGQLWLLLFSEKLSLMPIDNEITAIKEFKAFERCIITPLKKEMPIHAMALRCDGLMQVYLANTSTTLPDLTSEFYRTLIQTIKEALPDQISTKIPYFVAHLVSVVPEIALKTEGIDKFSILKRLFKTMEAGKQSSRLSLIKSNICNSYGLSEINGITSTFASEWLGNSHRMPSLAEKITDKLQPILSYLLADSPAFNSAAGWQYATSFIDIGTRYHTGRYILGTFGEQRSGIDVRNNGPAMALLIERLYKRDGSLRLSPEDTLSAFNALVRVALYDVHINNGTSYVVDLLAAQSTKLIGLGVEIPPQVDGCLMFLSALRTTQWLYLHPKSPKFGTTHSELKLTLAKSILKCAQGSNSGISIQFPDTGTDIALVASELLRQVDTLPALVQLVGEINAYSGDNSGRAPFETIAARHLESLLAIPPKLRQMADSLRIRAHSIIEKGEMVPLTSALWNLTSAYLAHQILGWQTTVFHVMDSIRETNPTHGSGDTLLTTLTQLMDDLKHRSLTQFDSQLRRRFAATIIETTLGDVALDAFANYNNKNLAPEIALDAIPDNVRFYLWWPQFDDGSRINMAGNKVAIEVPE